MWGWRELMREVLGRIAIGVHLGYSRVGSVGLKLAHRLPGLGVLKSGVWGWIGLIRKVLGPKGVDVYLGSSGVEMVGLRLAHRLLGLRAL